MRLPQRGLNVDRVLGVLLAAGAACAVSGCGQDLLSLQWTDERWSGATWDQGSAVGDTPSGPTSQPADEPAGDLPLTLVRGEFLLRHGVDGLYVSVTEMDFGLTREAQAVGFGNLTGRSVTCRNKVDVDWASVSPAEFSNAGELDELIVSVERAGLPAGDYQGELAISADSGSVIRIPLRMSVAAGPSSPPATPTSRLEVSAAVLELGDNGTNGSLLLRNSGGGQAPFEVVAADDWVYVQPSSGTVADKPVVIRVVVDLRALPVGQHATTLSVESAGQLVREVQVSLTKLPLSPRIVLWKQINTIHTHADVDDVVAALQEWQRVTDTACIITGPGQSGLFQELRERVPGVQIIPALSTSSWLRYAGFDSLTQWRAIGEEAAAVAAVCGQQRVLLENEAAVQPYIQGQYQLTEEKIRECLRQLPPDLEYIWYPAIYFDPAYPDRLARSEALCRWVEAELDCRFVDASLGDPYWWTSAYVAGRTLLESFAEKPTMPAVWFGCSVSSWCYWQYEQAQDAMEALAGRPDFLLYPIHWEGSTQELVPRLVTLYPVAP